MSLKEKILADIKEAMKAKEALRLSTLRTLSSAIKNREIEVRPNEITDDDVLSVIKKGVKQRRESISQFESAGRNDLVEKESSELKILETYLPKQLSVEELEPIVKETIAEVGATSAKDMGKVMPVVIKKTSGAADNKMISEIVRKLLAN